MLLGIDWLGLQAYVLAGVRTELIMVADPCGNIMVIEDAQMEIVAIDMVTDALMYGGPLALGKLLTIRDSVLRLERLLAETDREVARLEHALKGM